MDGKEIGESDNEHYGSILHIDNIVITYLRHNVPEGLGQNDIKHRLPVIHADRFCTFELTVVDTHDTAADRLGHVRAGIDRYDDDTDGPDILEGNAEKVGHAVIDEYCLQDHRCASEDFDISPDQYSHQFQEEPFQKILLRTARNRLQNTAEKADNAADQCGNRSQDQRIENAGKIDGAIFTP